MTWTANPVDPEKPRYWFSGGKGECYSVWVDDPTPRLLSKHRTLADARRRVLALWAEQRQA